MMLTHLSFWSKMVKNDSKKILSLFCQRIRQVGQVGRVRRVGLVRLVGVVRLVGIEGLVGLVRPVG